MRKFSNLKKFLGRLIFVVLAASINSAEMKANSFATDNNMSVLSKKGGTK